MREFACHTTVILAQPRVSRLRAGVIYVDSRGMVRHGWASAEILDFQMPIFFGDPLKSLQICSPDIPKSAEKVRKTDLSVGEIWAPKIAPTLRGKKNPITRWGPPVLRLIHPKLVYHCVLFTHFSVFSPKSALLTRRPPAPPEGQYT